jgi:sugar lactone lactonase YvrE
MKRLTFGLWVAVTLLFAVQGVFAGNMGSNRYRLIERWQTPRELRVPESVLFDEARRVLYVSNINGNPPEKNGQGFISKLSLDGKIEDLMWVAGLNAPKGMAVFKDTLYVADIDHLIAIDLPGGEIAARYPAEGALFLNDVAVDAAGNVYVSDMSDENSMIYKLVQGRMIAWLVSKAINKPNGLYMEGKRLLVGNSGDETIKAVDLGNQKITAVAKVGSGIDGLRADGKGNYFVSDWKGRTSLVTGDGQIIGLMDTTAAGVNSADLEYVQTLRLLLIPTFFDNRVVAYEVEEKE